MTAFRLGTPVVFTATLLRNKTYGGPVGWCASSCNETRGFYAGSRVVYEGKHERGYYGPEGEPAYLKVERGIHHAIVVFHARKNPARVPFDSLREVKP